MPRFWPILACGLLWLSTVTSKSQTPLNSKLHNSDTGNGGHYIFQHPIKRVAVIGAGPSGLQHAATLLEHGFEVRMFERAPMPGGLWFYTDLTPVPASFPYVFCNHCWFGDSQL